MNKGRNKHVINKVWGWIYDLYKTNKQKKNNGMLMLNTPTSPPSPSPFLLFFPSIIHQHFFHFKTEEDW